MGYYKNNPGAQRGRKVIDIDASQVLKLLDEIDIENAQSRKKKDFAKCGKNHTEGRERRF